MKNLLIGAIVVAVSMFSSCCEDESVVTECDANCALIPEPGLCNAAIPRYYFDTEDKKCKQFVWGGCGGVVPFETLEACENCGCE